MIPLPSPPTDNLYKFLAIVGLLLIVLSIVFYETETNKLNESINRLDLESSQNRIDKAKFQRDKDELTRKLRFFTRKHGLESNVSVTDSFVIWNHPTNPSPSYLTDEIEIKNTIKNYQELEERIIRKDSELQSKDLLLRINISQLEKYGRWLTWLIILGLIITLFGFALWLTLYQLKNDKLQKEQFYKIYEEYCQSCGDIIIQRNEMSEEYCSLCAKNGKFVQSDLSMKAMADLIKKNKFKFNTPDGNSINQIKRLPYLKRWR